MLVLMIWVSESITCEEEEKEGHGRKGGGGESWRETLVLSKVGTSSLAHASVSVGLFITLLSEPVPLVLLDPKIGTGALSMNRRKTSKTRLRRKVRSEVDG